jgi:ADP-ribosylglycohydrolase
VLNPKDEYCGALIRADAYGYACPGHPALAAELAWRDASYTHRRTGIYGTMFAAAAIATAFVANEPLEIFRVALKYIPRRSRFAEVVRDSIEQVSAAADWIDGYTRVHDKYREYDHCRIYQEIGTVINTLRFAENVGDGICMQVSQGNDTDSFGATAGSILGAYFGPEGFDARWPAPFNDRLLTSVATFHEQRLSAVARRMAALPARVLG